MGDYVKDSNGNDMIYTYNEYVVELYKNIMSSYQRRNTEGTKGAISIWKKVDDGEYTVCGSHVFNGVDSDVQNAKDGLSDAKNVFIDIRSNPEREIQEFIRKY